MWSLVQILKLLTGEKDAYNCVSSNVIDFKEIENQDDTKKSKRKKKPAVVKPRLNFAISSYYKGTGLEEVLKKLENYLDTAPLEESDINNI